MAWLLGVLFAAHGAALAQTKSPAVTPKSKTSAGAAQAPAKKKTVKKRPSWYVPTYADSTKEDIAEFDDPVVREVAVGALGPHNGAVVVVDPNTGRILSIVNQRLAFSAGFQPCSTIKPVVAVAALTEGIITRDTMIKVGRRRYMNLTEAMAHSNNPYFEVLGKQMGFETVSKYARQLGLGEAAGYKIFEEHPGIFPSVPPANGGVGRMSSYGEGIQMTPLQLAGMISAFANGGTLYHLQYPRTEEERRNFAPRVKRRLGIEAMLPELREGMLAAVLYGTARSSWDPEGEETLGKTGTCSDQGSRLGWYVSYAGQSQPRVSVVVLLRGQSRRVNGPTAADIAGRIYHGLRDRNFFAEHAAKGPAGPTP
jgi:penicillin-binding protein 2